MMIDFKCERIHCRFSILLFLNVFLFTCFFHLSHAVTPDTKLFEGRVFQTAGPGVSITPDANFKAFLDENIECYIFNNENPSADASYFRHDYAIKKWVTTKEITRKIGTTYEFTEMLRCPPKRGGDREKVYELKIRIESSAPNLALPVWTKNTEHFYICLNETWNNRKVVAEIEADDVDAIKYNSDIYYYAINDSYNLLDLDKSSGHIRFRKPLESVLHMTHAKSYFTKIIACDVGSPQKCISKTIQFEGTYLSPPVDVDVLALTGDYQIVCWKPGVFGTATYSVEMKYGRNMGSMIKITDNIVEDKKRSEFCVISQMKLVDTEWVKIRVWAIGKENREKVPSVILKEKVAENVTCSGKCFRNGSPVCVHKIERVQPYQFEWNEDLHCQCHKAFSGTQCEKAPKCPDDKTRMRMRTIDWRPTEVFQKAKIRCAYATDYLERECRFNEDSESVYWSDPIVFDEEGCESKIRIDALVRGMRELLNKRTVSNNDLQNITSDLAKHWPSTFIDKEVAQNMISVVETFLTINLTRKKVDREQFSKCSKKLHNLLIEYTDKVVFNSTTFILNGRDMKIFVANVSRVRNEHGHIRNDYQSVTIECEPKTLDSVLKSDTNGSTRFRIIFFNDNTIYTSGSVGEKVENPVVELGFKLSGDANEDVVFDPPIKYSMKVGLAQSNATPTCVYWNNVDKKWQTDGVETVGHDDNSVTCETIHATGFSILFNFGHGVKISEKNYEILNVLSWVGCGFSMVGLFLTWLTYSLFRCLNRDHSGKILLNLCVAMFLMNLLFVLSSLKPYLRYGASSCITIGVILHFSTLASLLWMGVEALNMRRMVVHVFATTEKFFMLKRCIVAWGLPTIIVVITVGLNPTNYDTGDLLEHRYCQLSTKNTLVYYVSYLGPACVILFGNCIIFGIVLKVLINSRSSDMTKSQNVTKKSNAIATQFRGALTVMILLGVTWIFGAFAVGKLRLPFMYMFCILNSLQGFIIFLVRCLFYEESRMAWIMLFKTGRFKKYRGKPAAFTESTNSSGYRRFTITTPGIGSNGGAASNGTKSSESNEKKSKPPNYRPPVADPEGTIDLFSVEPLTQYDSPVEEEVDGIIPEMRYKPKPIGIKERVGTHNEGKRLSAHEVIPSLALLKYIDEPPTPRPYSRGTSRFPPFHNPFTMFSSGQQNMKMQNDINDNSHESI